MKQQEENESIKIRRAKKQNKSFKMFYKARENVVKLFDNYTKIVSDTRYEAKHGKGFKI